MATSRLLQALRRAAISHGAPARPHHKSPNELPKVALAGTPARSPGPLLEPGAPYSGRGRLRAPRPTENDITIRTPRTPQTPPRLLSGPLLGAHRGPRGASRALKCPYSNIILSRDETFPALTCPISLTKLHFPNVNWSQTHTGSHLTGHEPPEMPRVTCVPVWVSAH